MITERLYHDTQKLYQKLDENGNAQRFYSNFFSTIVFEPLKYFPNLSHEMSTLLCTRLADSLLEFYKKPLQSVQNQPKALSKPENDSLEYLAGYVIHKLLKKIKNGRLFHTSRNQQFITLLESMLVKNEEEKENQQLISIQDRGGLKAVIKECKSIFSETEKVFRIETEADIHVSKINIPYMVTVIMKNPTVVSAFQEMIGQEDNYPELEDIFHSMVELYLRVRAFSFAKDVTEKYKSKIKLQKAKGSLRKNIKHPEK